MKRIAVVIIILLSFFPLLEATEFQLGQSLNIYAPSGLTLRASPSPYGKILAVVDYGDQVNFIESFGPDAKKDRINWVDGEWILVEFEGMEGYLFDGYVSALPVPTMDFEIALEEPDLLYCLESWAEFRLNSMTIPDTVTNSRGHTKIVQLYENNQRMIRSDRTDHYQIDLYLSDIRIMDAYHLLLSMMPGKEEREYFIAQSVFIENEQRDLVQVKIKYINPIEIRTMDNDQVRVSMFTAQTGCSF